MTGVDLTDAVLRSVVVGLWCVVLGAPVAVALGWTLARREFPGKSLVSSVLLAPLVLPPVVVGLLLLDAFGRSSPLGGWLAAIGLPIPFTLAGAVVAAVVVSLPLFVMASRTAFESVDPRYEEVARTLGDPPWRVFWRVTLPLALPGLAAGAILAFARALGEFGATAVVAGNMEGETRTISLAVYALLDVPGGEADARGLALVSCAIAALALAGYELLVRWQRRRLELHHAH